ncbi:MAG: hypothetical protein AAGA86_00800 [Bacteroidota bacterium]
MKNPIYLILIFGFLTSCSGVKKTQKAVNSGNYHSAIDNAIQNLAQNKTKRSHQPFVILLEDAFQKHTDRELDRIHFLEKDGNPANLATIYEGYVGLKQMQRRIQPLLPLDVLAENRQARFSFADYDRDILAAKEDLSKHLYAHGATLLKEGSQKEDFRNAYADFNYLNEINPGYKDVDAKMDEAHNKGLDYVQVNMVNQTDQIIPARLEEELLDFNTYGLDNLWTTYHTNPLPQVQYDYVMDVAFREINISPEQVREKEIIKEKQIKDGQKFLLDTDGNVVKDSLGNQIKIDKFRTVRCNFYQFTQFKTAQVAGMVYFTDSASKQRLNSYPLSSEFVFEHIYANYDGDRRALENDLIALLDLAAVPFPTNAQMVYDAGEDLKARLKTIVNRQRFN